MGFKITISENGEYIIGKLDEPLNRETAQQLTKEYVKIIKSTNIKKILNDVRGTPDAMGVFDGYEFAYNDTKILNLPNDIRAAIVTDLNDKTHAFQETVAINAGYRLRVFHEIESAVDWLLEKDR